MRLALRLFVPVWAAALLASCAPAFVVPADDRSGIETEIQIDGVDLDFGMPPIGSTLAAIPIGMHRTENCYEADYIDCEYRDESGVLYLVYGHTLTRKRIIIDGRAGRTLPFGLRSDETADQALRALNTRYGPVFTAYSVEGRSGVASERLRNQRGYEYWVVITARADGTLEEISVGGIAE